MSAFCPACSGVGHSMGVLGTLEYFRCKSCGWQFSDAATEGFCPDEHALCAGFADGPRDY